MKTRSYGWEAEEKDNAMKALECDENAVRMQLLGADGSRINTVLANEMISLKVRVLAKQVLEMVDTIHCGKDDWSDEVVEVCKA